MNRGLGLRSLRNVSCRAWSAVVSIATRGIRTADNRGNVNQHGNWEWWGMGSAIRISTLDPLRLTVDDIVTPGGDSLVVYFDGIYPEARLSYQHPTIEFPHRIGDCFLYYYCPPGHTPFSSSLRLRMIEEPSVEAFQHGEDFKFKNGLPWQIMACQMAVYDVYEGLRKKLIVDGLWTTQDHQEIFDIWEDRGVLFPERTLFSLNQEFPLTLNSNLTLTMAGKGEHRNFALHVLGTGDKVYKWPFSGLSAGYFPPRH
ncbi:hypothetical protein C8J57DRAFT_1324814 [Mycena rebaudengoi]|nr:hypothetical protein C8J57DRAFT_1324814 [Mycena rebaudengoi]